MSPILGIWASQNYPRITSSYESIASVTVGSGGAANVEFTSIPGTYAHLQIRFIHTVTNGNTPTYMQFNSDSGSNYSRHYLVGSGTAVSAGGDPNQTDADIFGYTLGSSTTNPTAGIIDILDYANTNKYKTVRSLVGCDQNGSGEIDFVSNGWRSTSAITSIKIDADFNFQQYSQFALYGIKGS